VGEADLVAEALLNSLPHRIEISTIDLLDCSATITGQVLGHPAAVQGIATGTVAGVEVAHHADLLKLLQVAVDGGEVEWGPIQADRDLLRGDRAACLEEKVHDHPARGGDAQAG
jgi:hypothetical protein